MGVGDALSTGRHHPCLRGHDGDALIGDSSLPAVAAPLTQGHAVRAPPALRRWRRYRTNQRTSSLPQSTLAP